MADAFATVTDYQNLTGQTLTAEQQERASLLLSVASDRLRQTALNAGSDLDLAIDAGTVLPNVVKSITVDIVARTMATPTDEAPVTQYSQSALGYTVSGTYLNAGGGIYIKQSELKALGLSKQRYGFIDLYGKKDCRNHC